MEVTNRMRIKSEKVKFEVVSFELETVLFDKVEENKKYE